MKISRAILSFFILFFIFGAFISSAHAEESSSVISSPSFTPAQVIAEINAYRQANGIGAMQYNSTLASLAQNHSYFMANTGLITHDEGGLSPTDRAYAAGYGEGKKIILSEIIFGGYQADVNDAMTWWKNSEVHNRVMLDGRYAEIGAGISTAGDTTYFTAEIAFITGSTAPPPAENSSVEYPADSEEATEPDFFYSPVSIAEPQADGSLIHIVQSGQTLWTIAAVYQVDLQSILDLNSLTSGSWVYPGDEILVKAPGSLPAATLESQSQPESSEEVQTMLGTAFSNQPLETRIPDPTQTSPPRIIETPQEPIIADPTTRWMILIAFIIIFGVVFGSIFFQKPAKRPPPDDLFTGLH